MSGEMKFHIFKQLPDEEGNLQEYPMCWDDQAVEFDTEDAAKRFLETCKENSDHDAVFFEDAIFCGAVIERFIPINGKYLFGFVAGNISLILLNIVGGEW